MTDRYALILAHNRPSELADVLVGIQPQVDMVWVIDNASEPPLHTLIPEEVRGTHTIFVRDSEQPPNLARLWNLGLDQIAMWHETAHQAAHQLTVPGFPYKVAVLTDDVLIPAGWMDTVCEAMDRTGAAAGCSTPFEGRLTQEILKTAPDSDLMNRLFGPAYVLRGEANLRCDERLRWWWNDTFMDWMARGAGGMITVPTHTVINRYPNESTVGVLAEQAGRDGETFKELFGWRPW